MSTADVPKVISSLKDPASYGGRGYAVRPKDSGIRVLVREANKGE
jgi:hypothetical protein